MAQDTVEPTVLVFTKQILGVEDLATGFGTLAQIREGENVSVTLINASHIPYDSTRSVKDVLDALLAAQGA